MLRGGVKNAPFSADVVTESSHTLADGNHIRQTVNSKVYRDSEGRTRREQAVNLNGLAPGRQHAADGLHQRSGCRRQLLPERQGTHRHEIRAQWRWTRWASVDGRRGLRPRGLRSGRARNGAPQCAADQNLKTESLGRQTIEGVQAEGRRTTMTIPAGQAGNELPHPHRERDLVLDRNFRPRYFPSTPIRATATP